MTASGLDADGHLQIQAISRLEGRGSPTVVTVGSDALFKSEKAWLHAASQAVVGEKSKTN